MDGIINKLENACEIMGDNLLRSFTLDNNLDLNFNEIINMTEIRRNNAYISWTNNLIILSSTNTIEEKEFYIKMCIKK